MKNIDFPLYCDVKNCSNNASFKHTGIDIYLCVSCADSPVFKKSKSLRLINENDE